MDTIRYLLNFLIRLAVALILVAMVWWVVGVFFPTLTVRTMLSPNGTSTADGDWLPAPGSFGGLFGKVKTPSEHDNVYVYQGTIPGKGGDYISYTNDGTQVTSNGGNGEPNNYEPRVSYIRNLTIYEGGHIYTGLSFSGDARNTMFKNGRFPIIIADPSGRPITTVYGVATTNWSVPGWVRFDAKVNSVLPNKIPCIMVFEESTEKTTSPGGQYSYSEYSYSNDPVSSKVAPKKELVRVAVPVMCN